MVLIGSPDQMAGTIYSKIKRRETVQVECWVIVSFSSRLMKMVMTTYNLLMLDGNVTATGFARRATEKCSRTLRGDAGTLQGWPPSALRRVMTPAHGTSAVDDGAVRRDARARLRPSHTTTGPRMTPRSQTLAIRN